MTIEFYLLVDLLNGKMHRTYELFLLISMETSITQEDTCIIATIVSQCLQEELLTFCKQCRESLDWWGTGNEVQALTQIADHLRFLSRNIVNSFTLTPREDVNELRLLLQDARSLHDTLVILRQHFRGVACNCAVCVFNSALAHLEAWLDENA